MQKEGTVTEYERAFNIVLDAAVLQWAANTKQGELREALDRVLAMPHYAGQNGPAGEIRLPSFQERPVNFVDVCPAGLRDAVGGVSWPGRAAGQA
jgi:hypothetical protein